MATFIQKTPYEFQPTKSDGIYWTVSADTASQPKFRYVYNLYVNDYPVFQGKATPNPSNLGIIDVSRVLNNYVLNAPISYYQSTPIFTHQTGVFSRPYTNEVVDYYINVGEEYADSFIGATTGFTGIGNQVGNPGVRSSTHKAYLGTYNVNRRSNLPYLNIGQFTLSGSPSPAFPNTTNCLFLTNAPRIRDISLEEYSTLSFTNGDLGGQYLSEPYYVKYTFYDAGGFEITSYSYSNTTDNGGGPMTSCTQNYVDYTYTGTQMYNILNVGVGPKNIYNFPPGTAYYHVQLYGLSTAVTPTPTATQNATPTPTPTISVTPSITPSSNEPVPICTCKQYSVENYGGYTFEVSYQECDTLAVVSFYPDPFTTYIFCACEGSIGYEFGNPVTVTDLGACPSPAPTPTPTPMSKYVYVRDCCTLTTEYQVTVDSTLFVNDVIAVSGQCWTIYALGGNGGNGDWTNAAEYTTCNECIAQYPCPIEVDPPSITKPAVEPAQFVPSGGTSPCLSYVPVSEIFQFNVIGNCNFFENDIIMFKNRFGCWDYFRFQKYRSEGLGIERSTYGQMNNAWGSSNPIKTTYSRGTTDYQTTITETHIVNSGYINFPEFVWLEELYTTNDAYLIQEDGTLFPINIVGNDFVRKTKGTRTMYNLELTYVYSNNIRLLNS
jgi:hypothetical protein